MSFKINILKIIVYLTYYVKSEDICDQIKHGIPVNAFTDEFNDTIWHEIESCTSINVCEENPCKNIAYARKNSCTVIENEVAFENSFQCECFNNSFWSDTLKKCVINNVCHDEYACGGPLRSEKCTFNKGTGHVDCKCKPEWMGLKCEMERDACVENYDSSIKNNCRPNGVCIGSFRLRLGFFSKYANNFPNIYFRL